MKSFKTIIIKSKGLLTLLMLCFFQTIAWAQDKKVDVSINTGGKDGNWYAQPWVWIIGGAVFLLLLVALLRGNSNRD